MALDERHWNKSNKSLYTAESWLLESGNELLRPALPNHHREIQTVSSSSIDPKQTQSQVENRVESETPTHHTDVSF
jgi:hypothetical protein